MGRKTNDGESRGWRRGEGSGGDYRRRENGTRSGRG